MMALQATAGGTTPVAATAGTVTVPAAQPNPRIGGGTGSDSWWTGGPNLTPRTKAHTAHAGRPSDFKSASKVQEACTKGLAENRQLGTADDKEKPKAKKKDAAVERTRQTVMMLDDVYKTAVVLITDKYVNDKDDFPAGSAAVAWFDAINKKGWHNVRLLDATGEPYDDKNTARDDFDREAIKQLKAGKPYYEQIVKENEDRCLHRFTRPVRLAQDL